MPEHDRGSWFIIDHPPVSQNLPCKTQISRHKPTNRSFHVALYTNATVYQYVFTSTATQHLPRRCEPASVRVTNITSAASTSTYGHESPGDVAHASTATTNLVHIFLPTPIKATTMLPPTHHSINNTQASHKSPLLQVCNNNKQSYQSEFIR